MRLIKTKTNTISYEINIHCIKRNVTYVQLLCQFRLLALVTFC